MEDKLTIIGIIVDESEEGRKTVGLRVSDNQGNVKNISLKSYQQNRDGFYPVDKNKAEIYTPLQAQILSGKIKTDFSTIFTRIKSSDKNAIAELKEILNKYDPDYKRTLEYIKDTPEYRDDISEGYTLTMMRNICEITKNEMPNAPIPLVVSVKLFNDDNNHIEEIKEKPIKETRGPIAPIIDSSNTDMEKLKKDKHYKMSFKIDTGYKNGIGLEREKTIAFENEIKEAFRVKCWFSEKGTWDSLYVTKGDSKLYVHPVELSGTVAQSLIPEIENVLKNLTTATYKETIKLN